MQKYLTTPKFYRTTELGGVAGFKHAPDLGEKFYLEQCRVSKTFHQLHKVKCHCKRISNSQPAIQHEVLSVNVKKARHNCLCLLTVRSHHAHFEWFNLLLLSSSTGKGESFTFSQGVALPEEPWEHCPPQQPKQLLWHKNILLQVPMHCQLHFTRSSQLKADGVLYVLQKLAPKPTPRENRTEQKTTSAPNRNRLFK